MPRKSAAALSVLPPPRTRRPEPPDELSEEETVEWKAVVDRLPPEWFPKETHQVLVAYCRHVVRGRMVARWIKSFRDEYLRMEGGVDRIDKLFAMGERESKTITMLATRMRITQQSRWQPSTAHSRSSDGKASETQWQHVR